MPCYSDPWDILLETCVKRKATDILLSPGAAPMIRLAESWRSLQVTPEDAEKMQATAGEHLAHNPELKDGYSYAEIHHKDMTPFRVTAVGNPANHVVLISRLPASGTGDEQPAAKSAG